MELDRSKPDWWDLLTDYCAHAQGPPICMTAVKIHQDDQQRGVQVVHCLWQGAPQQDPLYQRRALEGLVPHLPDTQAGCARWEAHVLDGTLTAGS